METSKEKYHEIIVDSKDRVFSGDTNTRFTIQMPSNIMFSRFRVQSVTIPFTYYIINSTNDQIVIQRRNGNTPVGSPKTINLTHGTYTTTQFVNYINSISGFTSELQLTFTEYTGKYKWAVQDGGAPDTSMTGKGNIDEILGFEPSEVMTGGVFQYVPAMSGDNFLTVRSNYIGQCLVPKSFTTSNYFKQQQNIISFVNVDANFGEVIFQDRDLGVGSFFKTQKPCYMNLVDFQLTFPDGTPVELPDNANWQLRCAFYYDEAL